MVIINSPVVPVGLSSFTSHDDFLGLKELVTEPNRAEKGTANFGSNFGSCCWQDNDIPLALCPNLLDEQFSHF